METQIDKAYTKLTADSRDAAISELVVLEKEITDAMSNMRSTWIKICEVDGVDPKNVASQQVLEIGEHNSELAEKYIRFARLYVSKVSKYKKLCKLHGIKPDSSVVKERQVNERSKSNNRESDRHRPGGKQRQPGRSNSRRVPSRRKKGNGYNRKG